MTTKAPDSPRHAIHAAMTAAKTITALRFLHWTGGATVEDGGLALVPRAPNNRTLEAFRCALAPWLGEIGALFPGLSLATVLAKLEKKLTLKTGPTAISSSKAFHSALIRHCAAAAGQVFAHPASRIADGEVGLVSFSVIGRRRLTIWVPGGEELTLDTGSDAETCFADCAEAHAAWAQGVEAIRLGFVLPPMTAHRRAELMRECAKKSRTHVRPEDDHAAAAT